MTTVTETRTGQEMAEDVADRYAQSLADLDYLADLLGACRDAEDAVTALWEDGPGRASHRRTLLELTDADTIREAWETLDDNGGVWATYAEDALDLEITGTLNKTTGRWEVTETALLLGYGGPTVRYYDDGRVEVWWGGANARRHVRTGLVDWMESAAEVWQDR